MMNSIEKFRQLYSPIDPSAPNQIIGRIIDTLAGDSQENLISLLRELEEALKASTVPTEKQGLILSVVQEIRSVVNARAIDPPKHPKSRPDGVRPKGPTI